MNVPQHSRCCTAESVANLFVGRWRCVILYLLTLLDWHPFGALLTSMMPHACQADMRAKSIGSGVCKLASCNISCLCNCISVMFIACCIPSDHCQRLAGLLTVYSFLGANVLLARAIQTSGHAPSSNSKVPFHHVSRHGKTHFASSLSEMLLVLLVHSSVCTQSVLFGDAPALLTAIFVPLFLGCT